MDAESDAVTPAEAEAEARSEAIVTEVDGLAMARERSADGRRWLAAMAPYLEHYSREPERAPAVQGQLDSMIMAVCARVKRIIRSDLTNPGDGC